MDLSIIIVSFNTRVVLLRCLQSVRRDWVGSKMKVEVLVVDNASDDGSAEAVAEWGKRNPGLKMRLIRSKTNLGFGKANNLAAKEARGKYVLFLNSDTEVGDGVLEKMVAFMEGRPEVGISSCRLTNPDGTIQPQGGYLPRLSTILIWAWFIDDIPLFHQILPTYQVRRLSFYRGKPKRTGWVAGTAMWVRKDVWNKLNGFDESLFMYGEDIDLCYRAKMLGVEVMINPQVSLMHIGRASGDGGTGWIIGEIKGLLYLFRIHKPKWEMPILRIILVLGMLLRVLIFGILKKNKSLKEAYAEAAKLAGR